MASKKKWKERAKQQERIADDLFRQVTMLSSQLVAMDSILSDAELPGPTIEAWAQQVRDLLSSLVKERGIVRSRFYPPSPVSALATSSGLVTEASDDGEYAFLTDRDLQPFSQETVDLIMEPNKDARATRG